MQNQDSNNHTPPASAQDDQPLPPWTKEWAEKELIPHLPLAFKSISGRLGGLTFMTTKKGKISVRARPSSPMKRKLTRGQKLQRQRFTEAVAYARSALADPVKRPFYESAARPGRLSAYNVAFQDYLRPPEIPFIQITGYQGRAGDRIYLTVTDSAPVASVRITIRNSAGRVVERACAAPEGRRGGNVYVAKRTLRYPQVVTMEALATDLAGNTARASATQSIIRSTPNRRPRPSKRIWFPVI